MNAYGSRRADSEDGSGAVAPVSGQRRRGYSMSSDRDDHKSNRRAVRPSGQRRVTSLVGKARNHGAGGQRTARLAWSLYRGAHKKRWVVRAALWPHQRRRDQMILSADGTALSARCSGQGVPIVMVHGTIGAKNNTFLFVEAALSDDFTVWTYDRRGRGRSDDSPEYSLQKEVEDLFAVIDAADSPPHLVAHSFGAIVATLAAKRGANIRSLVLYEPPFRSKDINAMALQRVEEVVAEGDLDRALVTFYKDVADVTDAEISILRSIPTMWKQLQDGVRTAPREAAEISGWDWHPQQWSFTDAPVLLMAGSETRSPIFPTIDELEEAFVHAENATVPGQGHLATGFAPWRFADDVSRFIMRH